jgi:hypothetical protein
MTASSTKPNTRIGLAGYLRAGRRHLNKHSPGDRERHTFHSKSATFALTAPPLSCSRLSDEHVVQKRQGSPAAAGAHYFAALCLKYLRSGGDWSLRAGIR